MGLFGMMNWLYTWYKPRIDPGAEAIARQISDIFLNGVRGERAPAWRATQLGKASKGSSAAPAAKRPRKRS